MYINSEDCNDRVLVLVSDSEMDLVLSLIMKCTRTKQFVSDPDKSWFYSMYFMLTSSRHLGAIYSLYITLQEACMLRDCLIRTCFIVNRVYNICNETLNNVIKQVTSAIEYDGE